MHIPSITNLVAQRSSVFEGLEVIIKNQLPYGENELNVYLLNKTVIEVVYKRPETINRWRQTFE